MAPKMSKNINLLTSQQAVAEAIAECDKLGRDYFLAKYGYKRSRKYPLIFEGREYDSKAIVGVAFGIQHGHTLTAYDFSGGAERVVPLLQRLGYEVDTGSHPAERLKAGVTYYRKDLMARFGGQLQSGIWTPKEFNAIFVFSGDSGKAYGYRDGWTEDGTFQYTGGGQVGNMKFTSGNKAIRDHRQNGKDLLLFEDLGKTKGVRYLGLFDCGGWEIVEGVDKHNAAREIIVFGLIPVTSAAFGAETETEFTFKARSIEDLRAEAFAAANASGSKIKTGSALRTWHARSQKVKDYVLARADGACEACDEPAPFQKKDGTPYLEPHHTTRLADEGPDHPGSVGAVCPTCHRRIHSGADGALWNKRLQARIAAKERR
jgi:5-methylcytosine-specific restriction protein A